MSDTLAPDPTHFARAVTDYGGKHTVVSRSAIYNVQGLKVIDKGVVVGAELYERLTRHRLSEPLEQCVEAEAALTGTALRDAAQALIRHEPLLSALLDDDRLCAMLLEELAQVPLPAPIGLHLALAQAAPGEYWRQALRSALVAGWLGSRLGGTRHDMRMLAAGGLLRDLGLLHLDPVLREPSIPLNPAQRRQLYTHPVLSVMVLERHHEYPRALLNAVLEHHERLDGSGYPRRVGAQAVGRWGRVLALAEAVSSVVGSRHPAPARRLSVMLRMNRHGFDERLVAMMSEWLHRCPVSAAAPSREGARRTLLDIDRLLQAWPPARDGAAAETGQR